MRYINIFIVRTFKLVYILIGVAAAINFKKLSINSKFAADALYLRCILYKLIPRILFIQARAGVKFRLLKLGTNEYLLLRIISFNKDSALSHSFNPSVALLCSSGTSQSF